MVYLSLLHSCTCDGSAVYLLKASWHHNGSEGTTVNLCAVYRDVWSSNSHYPNSFSHRLIVIQPTMSERGLTESLYFADSGSIEKTKEMIVQHF